MTPFAFSFGLSQGQTAMKRKNDDFRRSAMLCCGEKKQEKGEGGLYTRV
jgi:hypothetical protein